MLRTEFEGPQEHKATFDQYSVLITKQVGLVFFYLINNHNN